MKRKDNHVQPNYLIKNKNKNAMSEAWVFSKTLKSINDGDRQVKFAGYRDNYVNMFLNGRND